MDTYLEAEVPDDLCQHLFLSFLKKPAAMVTSVPAVKTNSSGMGKDVGLRDVAVAASTTACAAVVHQSPEVHEKEASTSIVKEKHLHGLAEKLHGLSEKLHNLGHVRHDSSGGGAGSHSHLPPGGVVGDPGRRSRTGSAPCLFCVLSNSVPFGSNYVN